MIRRLILITCFLAIAVSAAARERQEPPLPAPPDLPGIQVQVAPAGPPPSAPVAQRGTSQPPRTPAPAPGPVAVPVPTPPPAEVRLEPVRKMRGKDLNVHVEITISDQTGNAAPEKKTVSLLAADQTMGRVRASARGPMANVGFVGSEINVDARPTVLDNDRILLEMTLEYQPLRESQKTQEPTNLNESITVLLQNGKLLTISQAADPISDRRMIVEVKATVVK